MSGLGCSASTIASISIFSSTLLSHVVLPVQFVVPRHGVEGVYIFHIAFSTITRDRYCFHFTEEETEAS